MRQSSDLSLSHDDVDTVRPGLYELETLVGQSQPAVSLRLDVSPERHPILSAVAAITTSAQQTTDIVPCKPSIKLHILSSQEMTKLHQVNATKMLDTHCRCCNSP